MISQEKFDLIRSYLYHSGENCQKLTLSQHNYLFSLADGYGKMDLQLLKARQLTWDWSHIRDSSDDALCAIHSELQKMVDNL